MSQTGRRARRTLQALLSVGLALVVLAGCRTDADLTVSVEPDGSGELALSVTLDAEAVAEIGGADAIVTDDLVTTGWTVERSVTDGGGLRFDARRAFANATEANAAFIEIGGPGVTRGLEIERGQEPGVDTYQLAGTIDLSGGVAAFSDPQLAELLGSALGREVPPEVQQNFTLRVAAEVPGGEPSIAQAALGQAEPVIVEASGQIGQPDPQRQRDQAGELADRADTWRLVSIAAGIALALVIITAVGSRLRKR